MNNKNRIGFFTSSQASRLMETLKNGEPSQAYHGYVDEVFLEVLMCRSSSVNSKSISTKWGSLMEIVLFNMIGIGYKMTHKQTIKHSKYYGFWSGTPDLIMDKVKIGEIKSFYPKKFSSLSYCLSKKNISLFKKEFPSEYWQCVSNVILCDVTVAEIIAFMPYKSKLIEVIESIDQTDFLELNGLNPSDYYFMTDCDIEELPYLPDDSNMNTINSFEFEIPIEDIVFCTKRFIQANKDLQEKIKNC